MLPCGTDMESPSFFFTDREAFDMDLMNRTVRHELFGEGTIVQWDDAVVSVQFGSTEKKFVFPDAFREHLILTDKTSMQYVNKILSKADREVQLKRERDSYEAEKRKVLQSLPMHEKSQAVFGLVENRMQDVLDSWSVFAGNYCSGHNRGKPRVPSRIYPNSACLLTECGKEDGEEDRTIRGIFMVKEDFIGPDCSDGMIPAHEKYRIILSEDERRQFRFWDYFDRPGNKKWGLVEIKYVSNLIMACILSDILSVKHSADQLQLREEFFQYFCKLNKINRNQFAALKHG